MCKEFDKNMTEEDLDNLEEAIAQFTSAWQNMINVCMDTKGNCNEIISELTAQEHKEGGVHADIRRFVPKMSWQITGSLDDVFHDGFQVWLKACKQNILSYREHLANKKSTKLIRITRPAWIQETYKVSAFLESGIVEKEGDVLNPEVIRSWLEDKDTVQLETEISCHMDANDSHLDTMEDDYDNITLDEIEEEEYDWNPDWKDPSLKEGG